VKSRVRDADEHLMRTRALALLLACVLGACWGGSAAAASVIGPDVSGWQHPNGYTIDWNAGKVAGGAQFAFVKATEGTGYVNTYFAGDFAALKSATLVRGAYHFARPVAGTASAVAQARHYVAAVGKLGGRGDLPPVLDLEVSGGLGSTALIAWTKAYVTEVKKLTGRTVMIYTYPSFWKSSMANTTAFKAHPLWIATWGPKPVLVGGWTKQTFWQYTDQGKLPGMAGPVDMNVFNGTVAELRALANDAPAPPAPPAVKPTAPLSVSTSVEADAVTVRWAPPETTGGALVAYEVTVDGGTPRPVAGTATSHQVTGLAAGKHTFTVAAVNTVGTGAAARAEAVLPIPTRVALVSTASGATATVTRADTGAPLAGVAVTVRLRPRAGAVPAPPPAVTDAAGRVTVPARPAVTTDVSVSVPRSATLAPATGSAVLTATASLTLRLSATRVEAGKAVTFTGTTSKLYAGETVYRQSWYGGAWHDRGSAKVGATGTVTFAVKPLTRSTSTYRLWLPATSAHSAAGSKSAVLRVV
jgi:lysozyme